MNHFSFLIVFAGLCAASKPRCPSTLLGICVDACSATSCPQGQACCSNGCGHVCYDTCSPQNPCPDGKECCAGGCGSNKVCRDLQPVACPKIGCANQCEFGYRMDIDGCPSCQCCTSWCDHKCYPCEPGQVCRPADIYCITTPCPQSQCVDVLNVNKPVDQPCPLPLCITECKFGYKPDENGCQTCDCCDSFCDKDCYPCKQGQDCVEILCITEPCSPSMCVNKESVANPNPEDCIGCAATLCLYGARPVRGCEPCKCCTGWCDPACFPCDPGEKCEVPTDCENNDCPLRRCVPRQ